jgi:hypothetical protein
MIGRPAGMRRVPINPPRGHDPEQHKIVGPVHSWDPPKPPHLDDTMDLRKVEGLDHRMSK